MVMVWRWRPANDAKAEVFKKYLVETLKIGVTTVWAPFEFSKSP